MKEERERFETTDPSLSGYLSAPDEETAKQEFERLPEASEADLRRPGRKGRSPVYGYFGAGDPVEESEDLFARVRLGLILRLQRARRRPGEREIRHFRAFCASVVRNAVASYWRAQDPERRRVKNRLRYWRAKSGTAESSAREQGDESHSDTSKRGLKPPEDFGNGETAEPSGPAEGIESEALRGLKLSDPTLREILRSLTDLWGVPVEISVLIRAIRGGRSPDRDAPAPGVDDGGERRYDPLEQVRFPDLAPEEMRVRREELLSVWQEILLLNRSQQICLLLHLDGIRLFEELKVVHRSAMARALDIPADDFLPIWEQLPLSDERIGRMIHASPLQVIGYRRAAKERLRRRLKGSVEGIGAPNERKSDSVKPKDHGPGHHGTRDDL
jgi:hypothetical protein